MARLPLQGLRVLEITVVWAGPYCGSFLADLGAEVIRVESTKAFVPLTRGAAPHLTQDMIDSLPLYSGGTPGHVPGDRPFNRSPMFNSHARNKRSMTVNLLDPGGREIFDRLVAISDVLVENNPTETMEKLGISYESLKEVKDDIIMLRMPAYGSTGPYRDFRAHGVHIEGVVGHTMLRGYEDTDPSYNTTVLMSDAAAGAQGAFAVLAALHHRKRTGDGQLVELGQAENVFPFLGEYYMDYQMNGRTHGPMGNRHPRALQNCYPCAGENRWVVITVYDDHQWSALCEAIDASDLAADVELSRSASRLTRQDEINRRISEWTRERDPAEVMHELQKRGIPTGAVMNQADVFADPHIQNRGFFQEAWQEDCGTHLYPGPPYKLSETPLGIRRGPVMFGQDNEYVYRELLEYTAEEYAAFEAAGHVGIDYAEGVG
ncbi:MAG: CoA transferase [Chloroflexi bacterium]|nr:CoA transferase [Chloroflexota bacterium]